MTKFLNSKYFWPVAIAAVALCCFLPGHFATYTLFAFGIVSTARSTNEAISETVLVRDVPDEVMVLDGDITPLTVMMVNAKRKRPCFSPRIEKLEDDLRTLWGFMNAAAVSSAVTNILVNDGTLFGVGDLIAAPQTMTATAAHEVMRVTAIATNTLTVTRG